MVHRKDSSRAIIAIYCSFFLLLYLLCYAYPQLSASLTLEDGPVEWLGALALLLAAIGFASCARKSRWYILLALFCFFAFAEEISWGQRLFGFSSPTFFRQWNTQDETNLHNLAFVSGLDKDGQKLPWWGNLITAGRIFTLCCFSFGVFIPWGVHFSTFVKKQVEKWNFPLLPTNIAYLFLWNYLLFRLFFTWQKVQEHSCNEIKESAYGVALFICAYTLLKKEKTATS